MTERSFVSIHRPYYTHQGCKVSTRDIIVKGQHARTEIVLEMQETSTERDGSVLRVSED